MSIKGTGRISGSWKVEDLKAGALVCKMLLSGSDVRLLVRSPQFRSFAVGMQRIAARAADAPPRAPVVRRRAIMLEAMIGIPPIRVRDLAALIGTSQKNVQWMMREEHKAGRVRKAGRWLWERVPFRIAAAGAR